MSYVLNELTSKDIGKLRAAEIHESKVTYGGSNGSIVSILSVVKLEDEDVPVETLEDLASKIKTVFGFSKIECCEYKIILYQENVGKGKGFVLYECGRNQDDEVFEALDALESTLKPLLYEGKVKLTKELLKEVILPKPMEPLKIHKHLIEVMQHNPNAHPEWYAVNETLNAHFKSKPSAPMSAVQHLISHTMPVALVTVSGSAAAFSDFSSHGANLVHELSNSFVLHPLTAGGLGENLGRIAHSVGGVVGGRGFFGLEGLNTTDTDGETPLMIAVNKKYVECCMYLLLGGSDPNLAHPSTGNTSLHLAVLKGSPTLVKILLVFDALVAATNKVGKTALDYAKESGDKEIQEILELADERQTKSKLYFESNTSVPEPRGSKDTYLLSIDGGGIRAFNVAQALIAIESRMQQLNPKCEPFISYFDYVAGTSSGGIAALLLAYTDATPYTSRAVVYKIITDVFAKSRNRRGCKMKQYLQEILPENLCMADVQSPRVIVTSTLANRRPCKLHLMTNYGDTRDEQLGGLSPKERKVWEAGRATSAAPHHFPPFKKYFLDGGIMANNPTVDAMTEILDKLKEEKSDSALTCVLSLGTGSTQPTDMDNVDVFLSGVNWRTLSKLPNALLGTVNLVSMLLDQITHADGEEVTRARSWCSSIGCDYFRISPTLEEDIDPDTTNIDKIVNMLFNTEMHVLNCPQKIDEIAKKLLSK